MNPDFWDRLVEAARPAPTPLATEMPFGFDTRVLAEWRTRRDGDESLPWTRLLRGALVCAGVILFLSVAMNYLTFRERQPGSVVIADSVLRMSMLP